MSMSTAYYRKLLLQQQQNQQLSPVEEVLEKSSAKSKPSKS